MSGPRGGDEGYGHIDPAVLMRAVGGDAASYRALAAIYLDNTPRLHADLQRALAAGDCKAAAFCCHALKSNTLLVGAVELTDLLKALEHFARDGEDAALPLARAELARLFALVEAELRASVAALQ